MCTELIYTSLLNSPWSAYAPSPTVTPYEQRTVAILANLAWDTPGDEVVRRAKSVLMQAEIPEKDFKDLGPLNRLKGSAAVLTFASHALLQRARRKLDSMQLVVDTLDTKRVVWLDAKKERSETRPARLVHRAHEALSELELGRSDPIQIDKDLRGKRILSGGKRLGHSVNGAWAWSEAAQQRYTKDALAGATAFVEG